MGYNPSLSCWYAEQMLASSSSSATDLDHGQTWNLPGRTCHWSHRSNHDAAKWRGVLPSLSRCIVSCERRGALLPSPCCTSTVTSLNDSRSIRSAARM
jgi:hypothetical protein